MTSPEAALSLTLDELVAFLALHRTGSFTRAARTVHISQPGLSARIDRLERALGQRLVDRSTRPVRLTPAGEFLLPYATTAVDLLHDARSELVEAGRRRPPLNAESGVTFNVGSDRSSLRSGGYAVR